MTFIPFVLGLVGLGVAFYLYNVVVKYPEGEDAIKKSATRYTWARWFLCAPSIKF